MKFVATVILAKATSLHITGPETLHHKHAPLARSMLISMGVMHGTQDGLLGLME